MTSLLCTFFAGSDPSMTGAPRSVLNLLSGLRRKGIRSTLITERESEISRQLCDSGVEVVILPLPPILDVYDNKALAYSLASKTKAAYSIIRYSLRIKETADDVGADCFWTRGIKGVLLTGPAAVLRKNPLIWDIGLERRSRGWILVLHLTGLLLSSRVITQAEAQPRDIFGDTVAGFFASKFKTIYPGIGDRRKRRLREASQTLKSGREHDQIVVSVGSVHPRKNQLMLLAAINGLVKKFPRVRLYIVGPVKDEVYFEQLRSFVNVNSLENHVEFLGWREDIPELLGISDLMVLSSHREGVPHVIREAMFSEVPVVATSVGGVPEAIEDGITGFLIKPDDVSALRVRIEELLASPEKRERMGRAGFELAHERFSKKVWLREYYNLLYNVVNK